MKNLTLIFLMVVILETMATGQIKIDILQNNIPEKETIAPEIMEFVYNYSWCNDTTESQDGSYTSDKMLLQIAKSGLSKFSSYTNITVDSILMNMSDEQISDASGNGKLSHGEFMTIFKNYPEGRLTHTEKICTDWLKYEEDIPQLEWELTDSLTNILGYECLEAKCNFRGRQWTVFYCEDVPIMDGPWKLHGLPGLIMKANDKDGQYNFECIGINSNARRLITIDKVPFNNTDRLKYYDTKHRYDVNPLAYFVGGGGTMNVNFMDETGNPKLDVYDPVELPYDYIERDWRK